ncbi:MAG: acyltransferase [Bacteroidetes bacterium]|nr:MAG: acyltransferase [Bacteroidota bacterium]
MGARPDTPRSLHVGLVQMRCSPDPAQNLDRALALTREAARQGAEVICLPELFLSPYFCQTEDYAAFRLAEPVPGPTTAAFETLAAELDVAVIVSLFERRAAGLYHNTAAVIDGPRGYVGKYRKMHIPDDPRYYEKFYFTPGDLGFKAFRTDKASLGVLVCWDQWYPEAARLTALQGADVLFYPTAIGWHPEERASHGRQQHEAWELAQRAHAVANGCFVVAVNRTGFEPTPGTDPDAGEGIQFWGQSFVAAPDGQVIARAPVDEEATLVVRLDLNQMEELRTGWPFLRDRRIDAYDRLTQRFLDAD